MTYADGLAFVIRVRVAKKKVKLSTMCIAPPKVCAIPCDGYRRQVVRVHFRVEAGERPEDSGLPSYRIARWQLSRG